MRNSDRPTISLDDRIKEAADRNDVIPADLRDDFWKYYSYASDQVQERVLTNLGIGRELKLEDPEITPIQCVLRDWAQRKIGLKALGVSK